MSAGVSERVLSPLQLKEIQPQILEGLKSLSGRVLVIGDVGLDEYLLGEVSRISPEAPVPVLDVKSQEHRMGLAANVAQNVSSLGGEAILLSVIGKDSAGVELKNLLNKSHVSPKHLIEDLGRPTTRKSRLLSENHHIARVDFERRQFLSSSVESQLVEAAAQLIPSSDVVVIEDYAKGVLSESATQKIIQLARRAHKKTLVDPAPKTPVESYYGADIVTPNRYEAFDLAGWEGDELRDGPEIWLRVGSLLIDRLQCESLVMTRGKEGMSLFSQGEKEVVHLPTYAKEVYDVTGAGDTVIAALSLGVASGMGLEPSCVLANFAAGVVVGQVGCVPCSRRELTEYIQAQGII